jgi:hypothetical protein
MCPSARRVAMSEGFFVSGKIYNATIFCATLEQMSEMTLPVRTAPRQRITAQEQISARDRLLKTLTDYEKALAERERYSGHVERAQAEKEEAESDIDVPYEELEEKFKALERFQSACKEREFSVKAALAWLETSITAAEREYANLYAEKWAQLHGILGRNAFKGYTVPVELYDRLGRFLDELDADSEDLNELRRFEPILLAFHMISGNPDLSVQCGKDLLKKFEELSVKYEQLAAKNTEGMSSPN